MKKKNVFARGLFFSVSCLFLLSCNTSPKSVVDINKQFAFAAQQTEGLLKNLCDTALQFPLSINSDGNLKTVGIYNWTSGFFPGNLWYIYEYTQDPKWKEEALKWTHKLEPIQYFTRHHDIGFMMYCSYGNAYRITGNEAYKDILVNSAKSLCTRYYPDAGIIRSWNYRKSRKGYDWHCPVIIDNMMNIELLFFASKVTGDDYYKNIAISHAKKTIQNQLRDDFSSYHLVNYDTITGIATGKGTWQGYADNSTWSRGQAWGIYGYTLTYRETKDPEFLDVARKMADFFINHPNLPEDKIPYWDFNAGEEGYVPDFVYDTNIYPVPPRDVSAAAVTCSALLELSTFLGEDGKKYYQTAEKMLQSMTSPTYMANKGENGNFMLKHFVGSLPAQATAKRNEPGKGEVDNPCVYADYYYMEALLRYKRLLEGKTVI